ncbi:hypothetical protein HDU85_007275 [Gaertneriomyces sp. JEL0708]|nr:hypothetical protein HDU85_007275 [Gaertneriomyces sp. JEL0708]
MNERSSSRTRHSRSPSRSDTVHDNGRQHLRQRSSSRQRLNTPEASQTDAVGVPVPVRRDVNITVVESAPHRIGQSSPLTPVPVSLTPLYIESPTVKSIPTSPVPAFQSGTRAIPLQQSPLGTSSATSSPVSIGFIQSAEKYAYHSSRNEDYLESSDPPSSVNGKYKGMVHSAQILQSPQEGWDHNKKQRGGRSKISPEGSKPVRRIPSDGSMGSKQALLMSPHGVPKPPLSAATLPVTKSSKGSSRHNANYSSYQLRALTRLHLATHRRRLTTNILCTLLCPFLIILISALLSSVILGLLTNQTRGYDIVYCSNKVSLNEQNWPITNLEAEGISATGAGRSIVEAEVGRKAQRVTVHANFFNRLLLAFNGHDLFDGLISMVATSLFPETPCVSWYGQAYPRTESPYERRNRKLKNPYALKDSAYTNEISSGWLDVFAAENVADTQRLNQAISLAGQFAQLQTRQWLYMSTTQDVSNVLVGALDKQPSLQRLEEIPRIIETNAGPGPEFPMIPAVTQESGILSTIEPRWFVDVDVANRTLRSLQQTPWFVPAESRNGQVLVGTQSLDLTLAAIIQTAIKNIAELDQTAIRSDKRSTIDVIEFLQALATVVDVPFGHIHFSGINHNSLAYNIRFQIGKADRLDSIPGFPSQGKRQLITLSQLTNGILRTSQVRSGRRDAVITPGTRIFPELTKGSLKIPISGVVGMIAFPFGVSFLVPGWVGWGVREREISLHSFLLINGLSPLLYTVTQSLSYYILYLLSATVFVVSGWIARLEMFVETELSVLVLLLAVWGVWSCVMTAALVKWGPQRSSDALLVTFIVILLSVTLSLSLNALLPTLSTGPLLYFPPLSFYHALAVLNRHAFRGDLQGYKMSDLVFGNEVLWDVMRVAIGCLIVGMLIILDELGYLRCIRDWWGKVGLFPRRTKRTNGNTVDKERDGEVRGDSLVKREQARVDSGKYDSQSPLTLRNISKTYVSGNRMDPKHALHPQGISMSIDPGETFGLLGPNGAGKTTLLSIITKISLPTRGTIHRMGRMGVCPQFDILWDDLSVEEHLLFYARLKGISPQHERAEVKRILAKVKLSGYEGRIVAGLSGGERRRVSIGIAIIGVDCKGHGSSSQRGNVDEGGIIVLDEPTTGLDPEVRRIIWSIISHLTSGEGSQKISVLITTHSLIEAETLCNRVGVLCAGSLRTIGPIPVLSRRYAAGFRLEVTFEKGRAESGRRWIEEHIFGATGEVGRWERKDVVGERGEWVFEEGVAMVLEGLRRITAADTTRSHGKHQPPAVPARAYGELREQQYQAQFFDNPMARSGYAQASNQIGILEYGVEDVGLEGVFAKVVGVGGEECS